MESSFLQPTKTLQAAGLEEAMHVADFGAGSGFFTRAAARLVGTSGVVWAVDVHQDILSRVKHLASAEGLSNVEVVWGDIELAKGSHLPPHSCDMVLLTNILFMIEHKEEALKEVFRVLKPGGRALLIDWTSSHGGLGPHADCVVTEVMAKKVAEAEGFSILHTIPAGLYHWGLMIRKKTLKEAE